MAQQRRNNPDSPRISQEVLQTIVAVLALWLYLLTIVGLKWWLYPGWGWRGFLTDLQAAISLVAFAVAFGAWLFRLYRTKEPGVVAQEQIRQGLESMRLRQIAGALGGFSVIVAATVLYVGERDVAPALIVDLQQSNWKHAREELATLPADVRPQLRETLIRFVEVHELSERDQLKESRSLREDRLSVQRLLENGTDYRGLNSLTFAELSKGLYFVEDAEDPERWLSEGIALLKSKSARARKRQVRAALLARIGELHLAGKQYLDARETFGQALQLETQLAPQARIRASMGNTFAATGETATALQLYGEAESHYPEGRRAIFYSNFGYLLMLAKDYPAAKQKVVRALQIDPEDWYSYLNLGLIKESLGDHDDAAEDFRRVIEKSLNPDSRREARIFAGRSLELAGRKAREYLSLYLVAANRSAEAEAIRRLTADRRALADLYEEMATSLEKTNTHAIETYIRWFRARAAQIKG